MTQQKHIPLVLLLIRLSIFLVMVVWTVDKFVRPEHASEVFRVVFFIPADISWFVYIGIAEAILLAAFVVGFYKKYTYGAVLFFHAVSTVFAAQYYLAPFEEMNILLFAAWPMLAACVALFLLRDLDTLFVVHANR